MLHNFFKKRWDIILLLALSLVPLLWFMKGCYIDAEDIDLWLNIKSQFARFFYFWDWKIDLGIKAVNPIWIMPYGLFWISFGTLFSVVIVEKIWFCILFGGQLFAMYALFTELFKDYREGTYFNAIRFLCCISYNFNFFMASGILGSINTIQLSLIFLPLVLYFVLKIFNNANKLYPAILLTLTAVVFIPSIAQNPSLIILIGSFSVFFIIALTIKHWKFKNLKPHSHLMLAFILFLLMTTWAVLPYLSTIIDDSSNLVSKDQISDKKGGFEFVSQNLSYLKILHGLGEWTLYAKHNDYTYYNSLAFYVKSHQNTIIALDTIILIIILLPLLFKAKRKEWVYYFFLASFLIAINFSLSSKSFIYNTLYDQIFWLFKAGWRKFSHISVLSFSVLLGYSLLTILPPRKNSKHPYVYVLLVFLVLIILGGNSVMFTSLRYSEKQGDWPSRQVVLPDYWRDTFKYVNQKKLDARIFLLPINDFYMVPYSWDHGFFGTDIVNRIIEKSAISFRAKGGYFSSLSEEGVDKTYKKFYDNDVQGFLTLQRFLNTDTIIQRNDYDTNIYFNADTYPEAIKKILSTSDKINLARSFGKVDVYNIDKTFFFPHFYSTSKITLTNEKVNSLDKISKLPDSNNKGLVVLNLQNKEVPRELLSKSSVYLTLFDEDNLEERLRKLTVRNNSVGGRTFSLNRITDFNSPVLIEYDATRETLVFSMLLIDEIKINGENIAGGTTTMLETYAKVGDILKVGQNYITLEKGSRIATQLKDVSSGAFLYRVNQENTNKATIINESFEKGLWKKEVTDCSKSMKGDPEIAMSISNEASEGLKSLWLYSKNHFACTFSSYPIQLLNGELYRYSFDYKSIKGGKINYYYNLLAEIENDNQEFSKTEEVYDNIWHRKEMFIQPTGNKKGINLFFYAPANEEEVEVLYDNIKLEKMNIGKTVAISNNIASSSIVKIKNTINLLENNSVEYATSSENLIDDASFEQGLWQNKITDCTESMGGGPEISMSLSNDAKEGVNSLELRSKNHYACTYKSATVKLTAGKIYRYSFDYKNIKGGKVMYYYNLIGKEKSYDHSEIIDVDNTAWYHFKTFIDPKENVESVTIYFYAPSDGTKEVVNRFDNIKLEEWMPKDIFNYYLYSEAKEKIETPVLEFKKINPTKYRIMVHGAKGDFPLVFSESFHKGWKAYINQNVKNKNQNDNLKFKNEEYKILDGNEEDQASKEELQSYIDKGWVSDIGDGKEKKIAHKKWGNGKEKLDYIEKYKIDFVSKNFQDTIQNDNLPSGNIFETWLKKPLPEENHLTANGYANSWWINLDDVCKNNNSCVRNADGSYDFEMVVEFWPQRLFYAGLAISGLTLLSCLSYLFWISRRRIYKLLTSIKLKSYGAYKIVISKEAMKAEVNKFTKHIASKIYQIAEFIKSKVNYNRGQRKNYEKDKIEFASLKKLMNLEKKKLELEKEKLAIEKDKLDLEKEKLLIDNRKNEIEKQKPVIATPTNAAAKNYEENVLTESTINDIDINFVNTEKLKIEQGLGKTLDNAENLLKELGCLTPNNIPTYAGILLFGKNPQKYFKNSYLTFIKYGPDHNLEENVNFKGNLIKIIEESFRIIKGLIPTREVINGDTVNRQRIPVFPYIAIRELLINAIAHRDYSINGSRIIISMHEDRIEFQSPGGLPNNITPETILNAQYNRNQIIAETLYCLGYIEQLGSGMDRVFKSFKDLNKEKPTIEDFGNSVIVTIYK